MTGRRSWCSSSVFTTAMVIVGAMSQPACQSQRSVVETTPPGDEPPSWVRALREDVGPTEMPSNGPSPDAITPTAYTEDAAAWPRGRGRLLTRPLDSPIATAANAPDRAGSVGRAGTTAIDDAPVVVNINTDGAADDDAVAAEPAPLSTLERLYRGEFTREADRALEQFGYAFFDAPPEDADALGPVPADFRLGPGDEVQLEIWGSFAESIQATVDRDGSIALGDFGLVRVAGRTLAEATESIRRAIEERRRDFELSLSLGRLRRIAVHVVGEVERPGLVDVSSRATVIGALLAAGGPAKSGSLRRIRLDQDGTSTTIDLYDFLMDGDRTPLAMLAPGAVVTVPPIGRTAGIAGYVQRPGIFELVPDSTIGAVIAHAGGLTPFTFTPQAQIQRTVAGRGRRIDDLSLDEASLARPIADGELVMIGAVDDDLQPSIGVVGEVVRPGSYEFRPGMRVSDLVRRADGLTIDAFLPKALLSRQVGPAGAVERIPGRESIGSSRRVIVVDLARAMAGDPAHDVALMPLDQLEVRSVDDSMPTPTVTILGAVGRPGRYEHSSGLTVSALVAMAGNLTTDVYYDEAELIRRVYDEDARSLDVRRFRFDLGRALRERGSHDPVLRNGDQVVIRSLRAEQVTVRIDGEVRFPGDYVFPAGARITDVIAAAGGVTPVADLRAAVFSRESVRAVERERMLHLAEQTRRAYENSLETLVRDGRAREGLAGKVALVQTEDLLKRMAESEILGRIVIPFLRNDFPDSPHNLTLEQGDRLVIPRRRETVGVVGMVFNPTNFVAEPGMTIESVVERAGGINEYADEGRIYVVRADGNVESIAQKNGRRLRMDGVLLAGDVVLVPRKPLERSFGAQFADVLRLARQAAEIGVLSSGIGNTSGGLDVTTVLPSNESQERLLNNPDVLIERLR